MWLKLGETLRIAKLNPKFTAGSYEKQKRNEKSLTH